MLSWVSPFNSANLLSTDICILGVNLWPDSLTAFTAWHQIFVGKETACRKLVWLGGGLARNPKLEEKIGLNSGSKRYIG